MNIRAMTLSFLLSCVPLLLTPTGSSVKETPIALPPVHRAQRTDILAPGLAKRILLMASSSVSATDTDTVVNIVQHYSVPRLTKDVALDVSQPLYIRLIGSKSDFVHAVNRYFPSAKTTENVQNLDGFTDGTTVFIPMYKYKSIQNGIVHYDSADLSNYLTHELTHALINAYGITIPTWINEGFATYEGLAAQSTYDAQYSSQMSNSGYYTLDTAAKKGILRPLTHNESAIFSASYNLEFEDYAAVSELIADYGLNTFTKFLFLCQKTTASKAYQQTYHSSLKQYETFYYDYNQNNPSL